MSGWEHLKPFGYAPGSYMTKCLDCGFTCSDLDKRAIRCQTCAQIAYDARIDNPAEETLDEFVKRLHGEAEAFKLNWLKHHHGLGELDGVENWPLSMSAGEWDEQMRGFGEI